MKKPLYVQGFREYFFKDLTGSTIHLTKNDLWNVPDNTDEMRGELKTKGPWQIPVSYRTLAMDKYDRVYGLRTLTNVRESGYELEGRVSIGGKKYRGFTSSCLFERPNGSLVDVAIIYVCLPDKEE